MLCINLNSPTASTTLIRNGANTGCDHHNGALAFVIEISRQACAAKSASTHDNVIQSNNSYELSKLLLFLFWQHTIVVEFRSHICFADARDV